MEGANDARVALGQLPERAAVHHDLARSRLRREPAATQQARNPFHTHLLAGLAPGLEPLDEHPAPASPGRRGDVDADGECL